MSELEDDCKSFRVQVSGPSSAPALLFSNSLTCDLTMWDAQVEALSGLFRIIRYDGRGQGSSVAAPGPYSIGQLGRDALAILNALEIESTLFCGLSMGGMVGMWLLTHAPERITAAVLSNTSAHMGPPSLWDGRIALARSGGMAAVEEPTLTRWFPAAVRESKPEIIDRMRSAIRNTPLDGYIACCEAIRDMDQRDSIRAITRPTLVLVGKNDVATTPAMGRQIHQAVTGSRLVEIETGHIAAVERPDEFNRILLNFFASYTEAPPR